MMRMRSSSDAVAAVLALAEVDAGDAVAVGTVAAGARRGVDAAARFDFGRQIAVLLRGGD